MIRKINLKDIKEISNLYFKGMNQHFKNIKETPISIKAFQKILKNNIKKGKMYVLDREGIKGFLWYCKKGREYNLEEIFVTKKDKGYGKLLMNFLLKEAKKEKVTKINLDVHFKNKKAIGFFKKYEFSERTIEMSLDL